MTILAYPFTLASLSNLFSTDMLLVGLIALLLFGRDLPLVARNVGRTLAQLKRIASDATSEIRREMDAAASGVDIRSELSPENLMKTNAGGTPSHAATGAGVDAVARPSIRPAENTVAYVPSSPQRPAPAVSPAAALDNFRIDVKPPTKIPPPV